MLTTLKFERHARIEFHSDKSVTIEGHIHRGDYHTEKSLEALAEDALADLDANKALEIIADEYDMDLEDVESACKLASDLCRSDRDKLFRDVNEDILDAITDDGSMEVHHPQTLQQACDIFELLTPWLRSAFLEEDIDMELLDALTNPHKAALMRKAIEPDT